MSETLTLTRALAELKHVANRIKKQTETGTFMTIVTKANRHTINPDQFNSTAKSNYQSIDALMFRYNRIKSAIIHSNSLTMVKVGAKEYSVADVIERRQSLPMYKTLLEKLRSQRDDVNRKLELSNQQMETDLQKLLETQFSSASKSDSSSIEHIATPFRESRKANILDPLGLDLKITNLTKYIDNFEHEANFVLSEANALTKITIPMLVE